MISSVENGDDHTLTHTLFIQSCEKIKTILQQLFVGERTRRHSVKHQVWVLQTAGDRYNGTALIKQGLGIFHSTPPPSFPSPCLSPLYPITSLPPFHFLSSHTHTHHLSLTLHFYKSSLILLHSTCGLLGR